MSASVDWGVEWLEDGITTLYDTEVEARRVARFVAGGRLVRITTTTEYVS